MPVDWTATPSGAVHESALRNNSPISPTRRGGAHFAINADCKAYEARTASFAFSVSMAGFRTSATPGIASTLSNS